MRIVWSILWTAFLSMAMSGATAASASAAEERKGWEKIIVSADPELVHSVPSPAQLHYQTNQYGAFLHYGPAVFMTGDYCATPDPKIFNPTELDAEQWVRMAKSFDAKHIVFSTKHHNGFCLWPAQHRDLAWQPARFPLLQERRRHRALSVVERAPQGRGRGAVGLAAVDERLGDPGNLQLSRHVCLGADRA